MTQKLEPHCTIKQTVPQEIAAQYLSFEWSHLMVPSSDAKLRTAISCGTVCFTVQCGSNF